MSFDQAVSIIRKKYPNRLIWYGFEYNNLYIFALAIDNIYVAEDAALSWYSVDKITQKIDEFDYYGRLIFEGEYSLGDAAKNKRPVDISKEQLME